MSEVTEDMIGCLCEFWDTVDNNKHIGVLKRIDYSTVEPSYLEKYETDNPYDYWWECCRPIKPEEVKFYKQENYHKLTEKEFKDFVETKDYVDSLKRQEKLKA